MTMNDDRVMRYQTDTLVVTGDSPDVLEARAVILAAHLLDRPETALEVMPGYLIHQLPGTDASPAALDTVEAEAVRQAQPGDTLWAMIRVREYLPEPVQPVTDDVIRRIAESLAALGSYVLPPDGGGVLSRGVTATEKFLRDGTRP